MTESDWLACTDPQQMLEFLKGKASDRKLRLFAAACCRLVWESLTTDPSRRAVETAEKYANGLATDEVLRRAYSMADAAAHEAVYGSTVRPDEHPMLWHEARFLFFAAQTGHPHLRFIIGQLRCVGQDDAIRSKSPPLLQDVIGLLPFRPVVVPHAVLAWNDAAVVRLAQSAYDERQLPDATLNNGRLAVLADALEEAGLTDADILSHLRGPDPHVRGCWCLDAILGKS